MKKKFKKLQQMITAAAFAEEGDFDTARGLLANGSKPQQEKPPRRQAESSSTLKKIKDRAAALVEKHQRLTEAITFAEAGEYEYARKLMAQDQEVRRKILVVGEKNGFPDPLVNHAVSMAERLSYDVVALSVITRPDQEGRANTEKDCYLQAVLSAGTLGNKLASINRGFQHIIKFGELQKAIKTTYQEMARVAYVLLPQEAILQDADLLRNIPVFFVSSLSVSP